ncbi:MAG: di-heme oxidoredictase family protein, partial [Sodaliphilus sp.]|nr:di-heme oxidoredictase family protein [Sodaliphilus sp.]
FVGAKAQKLPRFPYQKIWPYTDLVQHRLFMVNDIRTGWCRTTPLWGRGLSRLCTGAADRLHDCRARNVIEAIMWHGSAKSDARKSVEKFRNLSKSDRDAVVEFINSI